MPFPSTNVCDRSFSTMSVMKTKARNRIDIGSNMSVALTSVEPDLNQLARRKHAQPSYYKFHVIDDSHYEDIVMCQNNVTRLVYSGQGRGLLLKPRDGMWLRNHALGTRPSCT
jgi:hypothetical protein